MFLNFKRFRVALVRGEASRKGNTPGADEPKIGEDSWKRLVLISNGRHPEVCGPVELVRPNGRSSEFWSSTKLDAGSAFRAGVFQPQRLGSCERSNTIDQKGVQQAFQRYHACLGRKVSNAVGRPSKPLPRMSGQACRKHFRKDFFSTFRAFSKKRRRVDCNRVSWLPPGEA